MMTSAASRADRLAGVMPSGPSSPIPMIVNQGASAIAPNLLVLGGTTEATQLCALLAAQGIRATVSLAGRVAGPRTQPVPQRVGGFGGIPGLLDHLRRQRITHLVDATHPFAAQMSAHAVAASQEAGIPLIALTRAPWTEQDGDRWTHVADTAAAVAALDRPPSRVFLAVGRMTLPAFGAAPEHHYLLRLVDPPSEAPPFPNHDVVLARGPFSHEGDVSLLRDHGIDLVVSKNAGGSGAEAKISAARALGLPVIMIGRPELPARRETHDPADVLRWIAHAGTDLGV